MLGQICGRLGIGAGSPNQDAVEQRRVADLRTRLVAHGVDVARYGSQNANGLADLEREIHAQLCQLQDVPNNGNGLLRKVSLLEVHLLVQTPSLGEMVLKSSEQLLGDGRRRQRRQYLVLKLRSDEEWNAGLRRAFRERLGLSAKDVSTLTIAENSHEEQTHERPSASYPELWTQYTVHRVVVHIPSDEHLELRQALGLGGEKPEPFMTVEGSLDNSRRSRVHLWVWERREADELQEFQALLHRHNEATKGFDEKMLHDLWSEAYDQKLSVLSFSPNSIIRRLHVMRVRLFASIRGMERELQPLKTFDKIRGEPWPKARRTQTSLVMKVGISMPSDWAVVAQKAVEDRLGLGKQIFDLGLLQINFSSYQVTEAKHLNEIDGYPGIDTLYHVHQVRVDIKNAEHEIFHHLGLPDGHTFVTSEAVENNNTRHKGSEHRLHIWSWGAKQHEQATGLEKTSYGLRDLERTLLSAKKSVNNTDDDLSALFADVIHQVEEVRRDFSNVDTFTSDVSVSQDLLKSALNDESEQQKAMFDFIRINCTRDRARTEAHVDLEEDVDISDLSDIDRSPDARPRSSEGRRRAQRASRFFDEKIIGTAMQMMDQEEHKKWALDGPTLSKRTGGKTLLVIAEINTVPLSERLSTDSETMRRYIAALQRLYLANPYHNEEHAATVCHTACWLISVFPIFSELPGWERVALHISAIGHDVRHFGRNNAFCVAASSELARIYNDRSVLENMHAATCFQVMHRDSQLDIMKSLDREIKTAYRSAVIDHILATDMANHFDSVSKVRMRAQQEDFPKAGDMQDRRLLSITVIKAADLSHAALPWHLHSVWSLRVACEFYVQGDDELRMGLPVSPLCDRRQGLEGLGKSQQGFLKFVCLPLFKELAGVGGEVIEQFCMSSIDANCARWGDWTPTDEAEQAVNASNAASLIVEESADALYGIEGHKRSKRVSANARSSMQAADPEQL